MLVCRCSAGLGAFSTLLLFSVFLRQGAFVGSLTCNNIMLSKMRCALSTLCVSERQGAVADARIFSVTTLSTPRRPSGHDPDEDVCVVNPSKLATQLADACVGRAECSFKVHRSPSAFTGCFMSAIV